MVLPAPVGQKSGTFTNADRTVHLSEKAVDPPGAARADLDIFLDYARRMGFRDRDADPLIKWDDPESAFEAWRRRSAAALRHTPAICYEGLRAEDGIQWPCTAAAPEATKRLYIDGVFITDPDIPLRPSARTSSTGALDGAEEYRAKEPRGRAFLHPLDYRPRQRRRAGVPLQLTMGRTVYHSPRTRTAVHPSWRPRRPTPG